ncbi:MsnO8 family LLM class oxidoreductase [Acuticoccus mangrovi]|uniref:MsnO8 family LLM class oxidoreductase n=1 Tax=Acuticoccus mangrovi TaxID=2796142 RepID=A0A934ICM2_9HYPH|nr:MsnO8 family LLM class oxidoreductase [Acuticoccus mangrovi]MBJ3774064.1 MsnO8 family LLM class oxidoreductase [Acuticoccus mangrovi]
MRLSVLDQSMVVEGRDAGEAIRDTVALANAADAYGYHRFWVSEHHNAPGLAGTAPEVLAAAIAMSTRRIRVGTGAVLLPHYAPLKVAEAAGVLSALAPGRIDLGLARGPGADRQTAYALRPAMLDDPLNALGGPAFDESIADVLGFLGIRPFEEGHPFEGIAASRAAVPPPDIWVLGSTAASGRVAGRLGLPYVFAHFFHDGVGADAAIAAYRAAWSGEGRPYLAVAAFALAAPTRLDVHRHLLPYARWRAAGGRGAILPCANSGKPVGDGDAAELARWRTTLIHGTGEGVAADLTALARRYDADEMMIACPTAGLADRRRSLGLIAEAVGLATARSRFSQDTMEFVE